MEKDILPGKIAGFSLICNLLSILLLALAIKLEWIPSVVWWGGAVCLGVAMVTAITARIMDTSFVSLLAMFIVWVEMIALIALFVYGSVAGRVC